jgi:integrase
VAVHQLPQAASREEDWRPRNRAEDCEASSRGACRGDLNLTPTPTSETVDAYAQAWLRGLEPNLKASTVRFYRENLKRYILPMLGDREISTTARADGRLLISTNRQKGLRLNTVKGIARTLSTLLSQAVEDNKLPANPCLRMGRYLRRGDEPKTVIQPLTREEAAHLVTTAEHEYPRWHPWILCALRTGMRAGELLALQWRDVDWHGGFILVQRNQVKGIITSPKSHQRRRVDMSTQLAATLLALRRHQRERYLEKGLDVPEWVFASLDGEILEERNVRTAFARLLDKAGLRHIRIHDLRHTFASFAAAGRISRLRQGATRTLVDSNHRRHLRASDSWRQPRGGGRSGRRADASRRNPGATTSAHRGCRGSP